MKTKLLLASALALSIILSAFLAGAGTAVPGKKTPKPMVVIANIDSGVNVYHQAFRDDSPLAQKHPCTYVPGYPCDAEALHLTFDDTKTVDELYQLDKAEWDKVKTSTEADHNLYWIPGTKVIGAIRFGSGGGDCPVAPVPPGSALQFADCPERPILDEHGHGTMTATRMGGNDGSLCPECRIVVIEGLGGIGVHWAADQGWIDVQTNSWLSLVPPPAAQLLSSGTHPIVQYGQNPDENATERAFAYAEDRMLVYAASGNGAAYLGGVAPTPTQILSTAAPGVLLVGAHDNGHVAAWSGAPAHVVADGYAGNRASNADTTTFGPHPVACCTSAASPYAAGGGAAVVLEARKLLGDRGLGVRDVNGVAAIAVGTPPPGTDPQSPIADGVLGLDEAKDLVKWTAEARPAAGKDDGVLHWAAAGTDPSTNPWVATWGPGANPYCQGCTTSPVAWTSVPAAAPAYASIGYGAVNERSAVLAASVLAGTAAMPDRSVVDLFFEAEGHVRAVTFTGVDQE